MHSTDESRDCRVIDFPGNHAMIGASLHPVAAALLPLAYCRQPVDGLNLNLAPGNAVDAVTNNPKLKYVLLHIGKTGGTSLDTLIRKLQAEDAGLRIFKLDHSWKLRAAARKRPNAQIGFVVRDPASRFVSAFNSRLRSGRPAYDYEWKTEEAIVFAFFPTANDLAEALCSDNQRLKSAAQFAMKNIAHLRQGYEHHLGGIRVLERLRDRIYCVCDLDDLNDRIYDFFAPLALDESKVRRQFEHLHRGEDVPPLSDLALGNLRSVWATEFEIYEYCCKELIQT